MTLILYKNIHPSSIMPVWVKPIPPELMSGFGLKFEVPSFQQKFT
jgi:hypothetical protein